MEKTDETRVKEAFCPVCANVIEECVCCPECGHVCALERGEEVCPVCGPVTAGTGEGD